MQNNSSSEIFNGKAYPLFISISLIVAAITLSFVDLLFLNDVVGKILDINSSESMFVSFALGMVGIGIMAHQGIKEASGGQSSIWSNLGHYALWFFLGVTFVVIRFFSASILQLDSIDAGGALMEILGRSVRPVDVIIAPLMLLLYIATGIMAKDGVKHWILSPERHEIMQKKKTAKTKAEEKLDKQRAKAEKAIEVREKELQELAEANKENAAKAKSEAQLLKEKQRKEAAYSRALKNYINKVNELKETHHRISTNIDSVESDRLNEIRFNEKIKPSLLGIVQSSIEGVQNLVALDIHKSHGESIDKLSIVIKSHNKNRKNDV